MTTVGELAASIRVDEAEIAFLAELDAGERTALAQAIDAAARARDDELRVAVDTALGFVPRPLRGRVLKMLGTR